MAAYLPVREFLQLAGRLPILDVRSPAEYMQGRIPGSRSFPLFSNEERKEVGTLYKQVDPESALLRGLELTGPKLAGFVREATQFCPGRKLGLYCWRGGMRSRSMAWLLETAGFEVYLLKGGYKSFRTLVLQQGFADLRLLVLGGLTGSGKTEVLEQLAHSGEQVLDLENLAHHKGSAFGGISELPQPTQEQFENEIVAQILSYDLSKKIWVEDESKGIGKLRIPEALFLQIRLSKLVFLRQDNDSRIRRIVAMYGQADPEFLNSAVRKISKRLGGLRLKNALAAIDSGDLSGAAEIILDYYDRSYLFGLSQRKEEQITELDARGQSIESICKSLCGMA